MTVRQRFLSRIFITAGFGFLLSVPPVHAQQQPIPEVEAQFNALSFRPDPLGFDIANSPDPTTCKHYEGIARLNGSDGTPYFVLTRSGLYTPPCFLTDDEPGSLTVVRMGSREKNGERLRSNRLKKGKDLADTFSDPNCVGDAYPGCLQDVAVWHRRFNGNGDWPIYGHPESMQTLGNILVVGVDTPLEADWDRDPNAPPMRVLFMNASDPENLTIINEFVPANDPINPNREMNGGIVAITPLANGRYLLMITGASRPSSPFAIFNEKIWFFESNSTTSNPEGPTDLTVTPLTWRQLDIWESDSRCDPLAVGCRPYFSPDEEYAGQNWPVLKGMEHQMFNFIRQTDGKLYLAGARGGIDLVLGERIGDDIIDLYRVDFVGDQIKLKLVSSRKKDSHPNAQDTLLTKGESNFAAATGFYISPSLELIFYATSHENSGPAGITTVGEWRHHDMVRPGSPTLLPGLRIFPPAGGFEVLEGGSTTLAGLGEQPATKAWIQLYSDDTYKDRYVVVDFLDWSKDNFDNFKDLDGSLADLHYGFSDEASSWRWFTPVGTRIRANDDDFGDDSFPGLHTRTLFGTGQAERDANLESVANNTGTDRMGDAITSVEFMDDVGAYYSGRPDLHWDAARDGTYSTVGNTATFRANGLDGPSVYEVQVKSVHPFDNQAGYAKVPVRVLNVAPTITRFGLFNNLNQQLGTTVPFFVEGLPVTVRASFTDPGTPDRQSAVIAWGDGESTASTAFDAFIDAFGGVTGELSHSREYAGAGTFNLTLNVTDDDLATTAQSMVVPVLTSEQAVVRIIEKLDEIIAGTTDPALKKVLLDARKALQWNGDSGALDKLRINDPQAALIKLGQTLVSLQSAQAAGANVGTLIALVEQVMASLL
jgi:hypothetical protein